MSIRSAGRTSWSSTARSFVLNSDCSARRAGAAPGARRSLITEWRRAADGAGAAPGETAAPRRGARRGLRRDGRWACATMCARTASPAIVLGMSGGIDSALVARPSRSMRWARTRALRHDAVALHQPGQPGGCGGVRRVSWASATTPSASSRAMRPSTAMLAPIFGDRRAGHDRREHPGAHPRHHR